MDPRDESLLQDLLDERLDEASAAAVRARLDAEPELRETWDELRRIRELVRGNPAERAPPDFLTRVRARIAASDALPAKAQDKARDEAQEVQPTPNETAAGLTEEPRGRVLAFGQRLAYAVSGIAALLLVGLAVRWMAASAPPSVENLRVLDSARAPDRPEAVEDLERLRKDAGAPVADAAARPPGIRTPAEPVPTPRPAPGGFGPGDQVQPNLRAPSDEVSAPRGPRAPPAPRTPGVGGVAGGRPGKSARGSRLGASTTPAITTWTLEADDLATGRARLALLVGGLQILPVADARTAAGTVAVAGGSDPLVVLREGLADDLVLGSVLLCLSADRFAALEPVLCDGEPAFVRGAGKARNTDKEEGTSTPATPDAPGAPEAEASEMESPPPMPCTPEPESSDDDEAGAKKADGAPREAARRVRVLLVRRAAQGAPKSEPNGEPNGEPNSER